MKRKRHEAQTYDLAVLRKRAVEKVQFRLEQDLDGFEQLSKTDLDDLRKMHEQLLQNYVAERFAMTGQSEQKSETKGKKPEDESAEDLCSEESSRRTQGAMEAGRNK